MMMMIIIIIKYNCAPTAGWMVCQKKRSQCVWARERERENNVRRRAYQNTREEREEEHE